MITLTGKRYTLKSLTTSDVSDTYVKWLNTPEVVEFLEIKHRSWSLQETIDYVKSFEGQTNKYLFGIYDEQIHIGNAQLNDVHPETLTFNFGLLIGDERYWGKGVADDACAMLLEFAFMQLNMRKFFGGTYSNQLASRIVLKQLGCVEEARLKERFVHQGKIVDQVIYSMTKEQWLTTRHNYIP